MIYVSKGICEIMTLRLKQGLKLRPAVLTVVKGPQLELTTMWMPDL